MKGLDLRCCLNPRVIAGLAVVALGIWLLTPGMGARALPLLITAICPLSMAAMVWGMVRGQGAAHCAAPHAQEGAGVAPLRTGGTPAEQLADLRAHLARVQEQREGISSALARLEDAGGSVVQEAEAIAHAAAAPRHSSREQHG